MAFRYSRSAMTGAAIFTLAGVTVLPLAQANAAPVSPQGEGASSASQNAQGQQAQGGATQVASDGSSQSQQQSANGQGQQAPQSRGASSASQNGQGQQAQGAPASQSSSNSKSASQNNQSRQSQLSAPAVVGITSVDGFIDPQKTDNSLTVETTGINDIDRVEYDLRVQELDEFGNIVNDDVSTGGASSINSDGDFGISAIVDGTKINPNHHYRVYIDAFDRDTLTASYAYYPIVVWNRTYIPVVPLLAAR